MNTEKVCLFLNGEQPKSIPDLESYKIVCATDGAYKFLEANNIVPNFISGDFDSIETIPDAVEVIHTPNQDFTDFDKVLQILSDKGFKTVHVFGASGKEQDHFLGNLHTALQWETKLDLTFFDNHGYYFLADKSSEIKNCLDKTVSLIPLPEATGIVTVGLKYALNNETLAFGDRIGTRNKAVIDNILITFKTGNLFLFIND
ncbi:thiamine diphosphokinase [Algibacter lectus]|uniref:Thiamine diphosphokinase n=1 Tax=Algibacter lectus TaxID=221126 RepID=A0A4R8MGH4_9FLAO|nr:thiamine diphosphokinase [Algibacter lectus]MWW23700.1 thiamine diphosphokinase [Algibacter lectus]TDY63617.1 thiamine pyrophosphokinase [Algibacter lectus]